MSGVTGHWLLINTWHWTWLAVAEYVLKDCPDFAAGLTDLDVAADGDPQQHSGNFLPLTAPVGLVLIPVAAWTQVKSFVADKEDLAIRAAPWLRMDEEPVYVLRAVNEEGS